MSRVFSPDDREYLYVRAGGKCQLCGVELGPDFHADHIIPWSKGGETTIENGQALCPGCNLRKGATMSAPFRAVDYEAIANRDWQMEGVDAIAARVEKGHSAHLSVACPGSGKTRMAVAVARALKDAGIIDYVIVVSPKHTIRENWNKTFRDLADMTVTPVTSNKMRAQNINTLLTYDGITTTYQSTTRGYAGLTKLCERAKVLVILDEVHWARESVKNVNRQAFGAALEDSFAPANQVISLSGTPWRSDRFPIPFVQYDGEGVVISHAHCSYSRAVRERWCRSVIFRRWGGTIEFEADGYGNELGDLEENTRAYRMGNGEYTCEQPIAKEYLKAATDPDINFGVSMLLAAHEQLMRIRKRHPRAAGLLVAKSRDCAERYAEQMEDNLGITPIIVHSGNGSSNDEIEAFSNGDAPWIISVNMITEGTDIPRLRVLAHLHNSMTVMFFRQLIGRIVRWEAELEGDQTAYVFMPEYGPLHLMAQDIEKEIPFAVDSDPDVCHTCENSPCNCPCRKCGQPRPCDCPPPPPPPPRYFRAIGSGDEKASGSTSEGEDFKESQEERAAGIEENEALLNKYGASRIRQYVKMSEDMEFRKAQWNTYTPEQQREWAEFVKEEACNEQAN